MMCLCVRTYYDRNTLEILFQKGKYYKHLGLGEMLTEYPVPSGTNEFGFMIINFVDPKWWKKWFEEPSETRNRKLEEIGI